MRVMEVTAMPKRFKVGDKVKCVDATRISLYSIVIGRVYTVLAVSCGGVIAVAPPTTNTLGVGTITVTTWCPASRFVAAGGRCGKL